jgi:hypothetical protein
MSSASLILRILNGGLLLYASMLATVGIGLPWGLRLLSAENHLVGFSTLDYYVLAAAMWVFVIVGGSILHFMFGCRRREL